MDWDGFPVILGFGSMNDLRDAEGSTPRLYGMKSVSRAAVWALHKTPKDKPRRIGFAARRPR
jgi:hypothetical protein